MPGRTGRPSPITIRAIARWIALLSLTEIFVVKSPPQALQFQNQRRTLRPDAIGAGRAAIFRRAVVKKWPTLAIAHYAFSETTARR
jgi:hypothetical protein